MINIERVKLGVVGWFVGLGICVAWGAVLGTIIMLASDNGDTFMDRFASGLLGGTFMAALLYVLYESPFIYVLQLIGRIPYAGLLILPFWLMYWLFVFPPIRLALWLGILVPLEEATTTMKLEQKT